jgi:hypothetical protein
LFDLRRGIYYDRRCGIIPRITINGIVPENDGDRWINISFISAKSLSPARFAYKESYKHVNMDSNTYIHINEGLLRQPLNVINDELVDYGNIEYEDIETEVDPTNTGC